MLQKKTILRAALVVAVLTLYPGCSTVLVKADFPMPPVELMIKPRELELLPVGKILLLSEIVYANKNNNATAYETGVRLQLLQEWNLKQINLFNEKQPK